MREPHSNWEEVLYMIVDTGGGDWELRPKTLKSFEKVVGKMSDAEVDLITERISLMFAPRPGLNGTDYPLNGVRTDPNNVNLSIMDYFPAKLERKSQRFVDSVVAHELAHVILHPTSYGPNVVLNTEREADAKILEWGFAPAYKEEEYPG